jgi:hypothetical protein
MWLRTVSGNIRVIQIWDEHYFPHGSRSSPFQQYRLRRMLYLHHVCDKTSTTMRIRSVSLTWIVWHYFHHFDVQGGQVRSAIVSVHSTDITTLSGSGLWPRTVVPPSAYDLHEWMWSSRYNQLCLVEIGAVTSYPLFSAVGFTTRSREMRRCLYLFHCFGQHCPTHRWMWSNKYNKLRPTELDEVMSYPLFSAARSATRSKEMRKCLYLVHCFRQHCPTDRWMWQTELVSDMRRALPKEPVPLSAYVGDQYGCTAFSVRLMLICWNHQLMVFWKIRRRMRHWSLGYDQTTLQLTSVIIIFLVIIRWYWRLSFAFTPEIWSNNFAAHLCDHYPSRHHRSYAEVGRMRPYSSSTGGIDRTGSEFGSTYNASHHYASHQTASYVAVKTTKELLGSRSARKKRSQFIRTKLMPNSHTDSATLCISWSCIY